MQRKKNLLSTRSAVKWVNFKITNKVHTHTHKSAFANLDVAPCSSSISKQPQMCSLSILLIPQLKKKIKCYRLCYAVRKEAAMCINVCIACGCKSSLRHPTLLRKWNVSLCFMLVMQKWQQMSCTTLWPCGSWSGASESHERARVEFRGEGPGEGKGGEHRGGCLCW